MPPGLVLPSRSTTGRARRCIKLPNGDIRINRTDYDRWLDSLTEEAA